MIRESCRWPTYPASDHYNPASGRFFNPEPQRVVRPLDAASAVAPMMFRRKDRFPPQPLPVIAPDCSPFRQPENSENGETARFIWFGHSTLLARIGGLNLITDPVFGAAASPYRWMFRRFQPPLVPAAALPPLDVVLISHGHYDHLEEAFVRRFATGGALFVAPLGVEVWLKRWGVPAERIRIADWYQQIRIGHLTLTAVPARHDCARGIGDRNRSLWAGWVLAAAGEQFYFSGDSSYGRHFAEIGRRFGGFDLAFVENGQYDRRWPDNHMFPHQTVQAALDIGARRLMPIHWGMFSLARHAWDEPVRRSSAFARQRGLPLLTPMLGELFDSRSSSSGDWWQNAAEKAKAA